MSAKRKWDQPAPDASSAPPPQPSSDSPPPPPSSEKDSKSASDAAAAAAAIAAKIAAQFSAGVIGPGGLKDDAAFSDDIDINDVRNRYVLTKSSTQQQIFEETGASVTTKGVWQPDRSKATEKDPPLFLHITAPTLDVLKKGIEKVKEYMNIDLGSLVEDKKDRLREKRKWPEEKLPVGLDSIRNFNIRAKVVGPQGSFVKYIQHETGARVQIKGIGSGFIEQETGAESNEPLYIHITSPEESQVARAKVLTEDLLLVVRSEHAKMQAVVHQQQMELHQAQAQYAAYAMAQGYGQPPPPPSNEPPPPPPGDQPPPPPEGVAANGYASTDPQAPEGAQGAANPASQDAYTAYWAAYGYDVNSQQFKDWMASQQQQQYSQYYAAQGYPGAGGVTAASPPPPGPPGPPGEAPPPPPPA